WVIPSTSCNPALTCCICSLRSRLFFLAFMLSSLSWFFPLFYHLPPWCKKMKRTLTRAKYCMMRLPVLYYKPSSRNDQSFPSGIETENKSKGQTKNPSRNDQSFPSGIVDKKNTHSPVGVLFPLSFSPQNLAVTPHNISSAKRLPQPFL